MLSEPVGFPIGSCVVPEYERAPAEQVSEQLEDVGERDATVAPSSAP